MNTVPVSSRAASRSTRSGSALHSETVRPNSLSFISARAVSSSGTFMMPTTGPKLSSRITRMR
jgi:hypothetical protein